MINHARVRNARSPEIERGRRTSAITGIVVHQTDADTSASSLNSYKRPKANGAHFLIDTDGTIYQTAAIYQRTNHVGPLKARCLAVGGRNAVHPARLCECGSGRNASH
jgi:N-acetyl-anhydromuramyl-L-alanine amidase AmpD